MAPKNKERLEVAAVKEKLIFPEIPSNPETRSILKQDLTRMGLRGLYMAPWNLRNQEMLEELASGQRRPRFAEDLVRAQPKVWDRTLWRATYGFPESEVGYISVREDEAVTSCFSQPANSHDGYRVEHCIDPRRRNVLLFLLPILNPERPSYISNKLVKSLLEAYEGNQMIGWHIILEDVLGRIARKVNNGKASPLVPFMFHLYHYAECMDEEEQSQYISAVEDRMRLYPEDYEGAAAQEVP